MASLFSMKIDNLRKRSRVLLTSLEENAKIVRKEVKKLRLRDLSKIRYLKNRQFIYGRHSDIWKLRNDSSGVGAALCPDYFRFSPKHESQSVPDMSGNRRILIKTDKKYPKPSPPRRAIKECYCYNNSPKPETKRMNQRSARTRLKNDEMKVKEIKSTVSAPESARINLNDLCQTNEDYFYSPPLSSATLRRAQKIDYTPRSKFLRRVQSKVNTLRNSSAGSTPRTTITDPRAQSPPDTAIPNRNYKNMEDEMISGIDNYYKKKKESNEYPRKHNCIHDDKRDDKIPKKTLLPKKTIVSKKSDHQKSFDSKLNENNFESKITPRYSEALEKNCNNFVTHKKNDKVCCPCVSEHCTPAARLKFREEIFDDEPLDHEINNVRKFREKNYFDTHASNPSLLGSRSSGSLQQFRLNERLFPEPIRKIHREDLVVSIPPCATRQKRGIHYFPRNIVKQEKNTSSVNNCLKKRRCPSCPLIGHAIDLGALKVSHPTNSLALRFQKGIP